MTTVQIEYNKENFCGKLMLTGLALVVPPATVFLRRSLGIQFVLSLFFELMSVGYLISAFQILSYFFLFLILSVMAHAVAVIHAIVLVFKAERKVIAPVLQPSPIRMGPSPSTLMSASPVYPTMGGPAVSPVSAAYGPYPQLSHPQIYHQSPQSQNYPSYPQYR